MAHRTDGCWGAKCWRQRMETPYGKAALADFRPVGLKILRGLREVTKYIQAAQNYVDWKLLQEVLVPQWMSVG